MATLKIRKLRRPKKQQKTMSSVVGRPNVSTASVPTTPLTDAEFSMAAKRLRLGRWTSLRKQSLVQRMMSLQQEETDLRDMEPDLILMRAIIADFIENYEILTNALIAWYHDQGEKPKRIPDILEAVNMLEKSSRLIQRMHQIEESGSISLTTFRRVIEQFGLIVAAHVHDQHALAKIEEQWASITIETKKKQKEEPPIDVEAIGSDRQLTA